MITIVRDGKTPKRNKENCVLCEVFGEKDSCTECERRQLKKELEEARESVNDYREAVIQKDKELEEAREAIKKFCPICMKNWIALSCEECPLSKERYK